MSTTVSMILGLVFLALGIAAVVLQAWLWGPQFWDEEANKSLAPLKWRVIHRLAGYGYAGIYVVMMWHMVPRLWQYQFELPARTVLHAVAAILIGCILVSKILILRFFRHFEEAMPKLGFTMLLCTVVLTVLSVPHALRAHDLGGRTVDPENVARVRRVLNELNLGTSHSVESLTTPASFKAGRRVLVQKCVTCHDMRTILTRPRTGSGWQRVAMRMLDKPMIMGEPLIEDDIPVVTAYLVAITPDIQRSTKRRSEAERAQALRTASMEAATKPDASSGATDNRRARQLLSTRCTECHELEEVEEHGGDSLEGWSEIVQRMAVEEGAEVSQEEARIIAGYLAREYPAATGEGG